MKFSSSFDDPTFSEADIITNRQAGRVYVADFRNKTGKYLRMVIDDDSEQYDIGLKISPKIEVRITYITQDEKIKGVQIAKVSGGNVDKINLSTLGFEGVLNLLHVFSELDLKSITNRSIVLDSSIIDDEEALKAHLKTILADEKGAQILGELASSRGLISEGDIGNISKKRESLAVFEKLFSDVYFEEKKQEWGKRNDEDVWQHFFENNKWIFGYGLEYVFNAPIDKDKFEQTLVGNSFLNSGKRPDAILRTLGLTQFMNIVEIKTHKTRLMNETQYRKSGVWQVSSELTGAISQCQQYVRKSVRNLEEYFDLTDGEGNRTNEEVFNFSPKCFLVIGHADKDFLHTENKVLNPDKLSCFEYFRRNLLTPEVITFDQLYMRAKNIVEHNS